MEEELRDMKSHKDHYNMLYFVADAQQGIPKLCPCGSIMKEVVDEEDTYDYLPGKRYFICKDYENDGLHFRQPWVMGMQQEVERLKIKVYEQEKLLRECQALKVRMLHMRLTELETGQRRLVSKRTIGYVIYSQAFMNAMDTLSMIHQSLKKET